MEFPKTIARNTLEYFVCLCCNVRYAMLNNNFGFRNNQRTLMSIQFTYAMSYGRVGRMIHSVAHGDGVSLNFLFVRLSLCQGTSARVAPTEHDIKNLCLNSS